ncbi:MAG: pyrroline-5-carboxylate reductase [Lachnospiraceae bacterium]|nr:pyrroline-5-carboxylate reductase [Lachnospiraceae bacterium]
MKIGFIGLGNMAEAIIGGMLGKGAVCAADIQGSCRTEETALRMAQRYGITAGTDNRKTAAEADYLFLAVKPIFFPEVIAQIREAVSEETVIISIAAGKTMDWIESAFEKKIRLVRCMPNTPALVGAGCTAFCANDSISQAEKSQVARWLGSFGTVSEVPERLMDTVVGVSGSSPAYVFLFIEAMADEAVAEGMPRRQAYEMAAQAVLGSARMVLETGKHPGELKDMMCTPGQTTIEAVKVLKKKGMRGAVMDAMAACIRKSREL